MPVLLREGGVMADAFVWAAGCCPKGVNLFNAHSFCKRHAAASGKDGW